MLGVKELRASQVKTIDGVEYLILGSVMAGEPGYYIVCKCDDKMPAPIYFIQDETELKKEETK